MLTGLHMMALEDIHGLASVLLTPEPKKELSLEKLHLEAILPNQLGTALHCAASCGNEPFFRLLVEAGANYHTRTHEDSSLFYIITRHYLFNSSSTQSRKILALLRFVLADQAARGIQFPPGRDAVEGIIEFLDLYEIYFGKSIDARKSMLRNVLDVFFRDHNVQRLFPTDRMVMLIHRFADMSLISDIHEIPANDFRKVLFEFLSGYPAISLTERHDHPRPHSKSLVTKLILSTPTTHAHPGLARLLSDNQLRPYETEWPHCLPLWVVDIKARGYNMRRHMNRIIEESSYDITVRNGDPRYANQRYSAIDDAWIYAFESRSHPAVNELMAHWPPPNPRTMTVIVTELLRDPRPDEDLRFLNKAMQYNIDTRMDYLFPDELPLDNHRGTLLHQIIRLFYSCDRYTWRMAKRHCVRLIEMAQGSGQAFVSSRAGAEKATPRVLLRRTVSWKDGWEQVAAALLSGLKTEIKSFQLAPPSEEIEEPAADDGGGYYNAQF